MQAHPESGPTQNPYPEQQPHPPDSGVVEQSRLLVQEVQVLKLTKSENSISRTKTIFKKKQAETETGFKFSLKVKQAGA